MCWIVFAVMCFVGVPAVLIVLSINALPLIVRIALSVLVIGLWWGPFVYAMYLSVAFARGPRTVSGARALSFLRPARFAADVDIQDAIPETTSFGGRRLEALRQLAELRSQGVLTEAEFAAEKARILGRDG